MIQRLGHYVRLMRVDRPIGTFLLLWPTLWALWLAGEGHPDAKVFTVFVIGVFVMRAAGCVINDFADRNIDGHVKRTRERPLATGAIRPWEALLLFALLGLTAFGLVLTMNTLTIKLAFVGIFLAASYPFMKRYTYLPQAYLGIAFGWAAPMVWAAQTGGLSELAWLVFIAVILWALAYDTIYGMVDRDDDLKIGVKSAAILFGELDRLIIGLIQLALLLTLYLIGQQAELGGTYLWGMAFGAANILWQQVLIFRRRRDDCFRAFLSNNWFGFFIFAGILLDYTFRG
ncbi:4-hydroxybenzoate octaprenyltransferase [Natronospira sp. AB-CW4]|uniref:4-hydroxybenzoate octaprenyltransferase n=1 Tax=Natronospira bacteriovora TaxID=3069753 RepID=A0ABU0W895_9GAMM|nr:4-hydroxybenzoate octaprenyltransferase [Natronospira sp. AB-CW4]MDQ2070187.1 4-hydroxybenzoate octaprenyltransferase [Natronospira sp. AB-CW4]